MNNIGIGTDPEFFVYDGDQIGSAIGKIGGTKDNPIQLTHGGAQEDNVLAEINPPPAYDKSSFVSQINNLMAEVEAIVGPLAVISGHEYTKRALKSFGPLLWSLGASLTTTHGQDTSTCLPPRTLYSVVLEVMCCSATLSITS